MKKGLSKVFCTLGALFLVGGVVGFASCKSSGSSKKEPVVSNFQPDDTDYNSMKMEKTSKVRFHYHRNDNDTGSYANYVNWQIWAWDMTNGGPGGAYTFDHYDDYGVFVDISLSQVAGENQMSKMGFIVAITETWAKDPDSDRSIDIADQSMGGIQNVYVKTKSTKIYDDPKTALKSSLDSVVLWKDSAKEIYVSFAPDKDTFAPAKKNFTLLVNDQEVKDFTMTDYVKNKTGGGGTVHLVLKDNLNLSDKVVVKYKFDKSWTDESVMLITTYFDTEEFKNNYSYTGDDLGAALDNETNPTKTTFKVWAPTSQAVTLKVYNSSDYRTDKTPYKSVPMTLGQKGVWSVEVAEDLSNKYYTYEVTNALGTNEVTDPYAKSAGLNGKRGMIVNFTKINEELMTWNTDARPNFGDNGSDAIIYEIHVRDMTINPNSGVDEAKRGKYLGLAQEGTTFTKGETTVSTGLDHLKELGITHVQIQPTYDYNSVDESLPNSAMSDENYNWGYDPQNYNVLEGSYSSNPLDGAVRIKEFKQMVMALHKAGISVNMDVVYNHTGSTEGSNFQLLVPNYYYRTYYSGKFYNGSGCGNEIASDRSMGRKFIVDSIKFWTDEYHLSGFRFDLMGLEDNQTMIDVFDAARAIYDKAMVYGEPWTGGTSKISQGNDAAKLSEQQTVQSSLGQSYFAGNQKYVGAFNDVIRNAIKGDNGPGLGWVQGQANDGYSIRSGIQGLFSNSSAQSRSVEPEQVLNYVSCHDNYTLYDHLIQSSSIKGEAFNNMYSQAESVVLTSQGVAFMQEGEDFMRTKAYVKDGHTYYSGNSYNVGDNINNMDYELKVTNKAMFEKFKEMIAIRKATPELTLKSRALISSALYATKDETGKITETVKYNRGDLYFYVDNTANGDGKIMVIHGLTSGSYDLDGNYDMIFSNHARTYPENVNIVELGDNETVVLRAR